MLFQFFYRYFLHMMTFHIYLPPVKHRSNKATVFAATHSMQPKRLAGMFLIGHSSASKKEQRW